ncbi:MAG: hypothetical protein ACYSUI_14820 [Planctomycetota bacterium]
MRRSLGHQCWLKVAALLAAGGSLLQTGACNQDLSSLGASLTASIAGQFIESYFNDQFNVPGSFF